MAIVCQGSYFSESSQYVLIAAGVSIWTGIAGRAEIMGTMITREWQFADDTFGGKKDNLDLIFLTIFDS